MIKKINIYARIIGRFITYFWYVLRNSPRLKPGVFVFGGQSYQYFYHPHNHTWNNERAVEIPLAVHEVLKHTNKSILEVGNVLSHYLPVSHDIVDKYEQAPGVINVDIVDYSPSKKYDLIVSISTIEHVGWDEDPHLHQYSLEKNKVVTAVQHLRQLLKKNGRLFVTVPLAYNTELGKLLKKNRLPVDSIRYLKRITAENSWQEVPASSISNIKYNSPYEAANGLAVLLFDNR